MRPVNKGNSPYVTISDYSEALPYLEERIGIYCSYCEFRIDHVPEVEHISSKSEGGDRTAWSNLLLGCKYCNTRKSHTVTPLNKDDYLWPDTDNTAIAYSYIGGFPKVNARVLRQLDPSGQSLKKAINLYELVNLGNKPGPKDKDRRFKNRIEAYGRAERSLQMWQTMTDKEDPAVSGFLEQTIELAKCTGFFSIWAEVFKCDPYVLNALICAFPGTDHTVFDKNGYPKMLLKAPDDGVE